MDKTCVQNCLKRPVIKLQKSTELNLTEKCRIRRYKRGKITTSFSMYNIALWILILSMTTTLKLDIFGGIMIAEASLDNLQICMSDSSFQREIATSSFVSAWDSPALVKFGFLRRTYVSNFPLKIVLITDQDTHFESLFIQAHKLDKNDAIGSFNSTYTDEDISLISCGENQENVLNTATTGAMDRQFKKRSKITLYWNPPSDYKNTVIFRVNAFTSDRPTQGWRGLTSVEIIHKPKECFVGDGASYRGSMDHTKSGIRCQRWDSQTPHTHIFSSQNDRFAEKGLDSNFCRKPDKDSNSWCYTMEEKPVYEACDVRKCSADELPSHFIEFGETVGDTKLSRQSGEIGRLNFTSGFPMVKSTYKSATVYEDGILVLGINSSVINNIKLHDNGTFTIADPTKTKGKSTAVVAPFWTNIKRNKDSLGQSYVFYRESSEPDVILPLRDYVTTNLRHKNKNADAFEPTWAFIATWNLVGDVADETNVKNLNTFQAVLTTDGKRSFVLFNYAMKKCSDKEHTALVGYRAGDAFRFLNHSLSYTKPDQLETASTLGRAVTSQSNVGRPGQMMYEISMCEQQIAGDRTKRCLDSLTLRLTPPAKQDETEGRSGSTSNVCVDVACSGNKTCDINTGECVCKAGYSGDQCQTNIDECKPNPCQNRGKCTDKINGYNCTCIPGYTGIRCENNINDCLSSPCRNNGECVDGENSYSCVCTEEYYGVNCEIPRNQCESSPCRNEGKCTQMDESYVCDCVSGTSGKQCQYRYCVDGSCENSHECFDQKKRHNNCTCRNEGSYDGYCYKVTTVPPECPRSRTGSDPTGYISWPATIVGGTAISSCPTPTSKTATRKCNFSSWGEPDVSSCTPLSTTSRTLQEIAKLTIDSDTAYEVADRTLNVTGNKEDDLVAYDISNVADILLKVVDVIGATDNFQISNDLINTVSNVIEAPTNEIRVASQEFSSNSRLVEVVDKVLLNVEVDPEVAITVNSPNIAAIVSGVDKTENFTGLSFTLSDNFQPGVSANTEDGAASDRASIFLPSSITDSIDDANFSRIQFAVYKKTALFDHARVDEGVISEIREDSNVTVFSDHVVSASIGEAKISGLNDNVTIVISRSNTYYGKGPSCVFYNFPADGGEGSWSSEGCYVEESTSTETTCVCNHLTNFAVIMDVYGTVEYFDDYQNMILRILTYIGCGLSIFGLLCTLISYAIFEKLRKEAPAKILICLCAALITVNVVYLCLQSAYYSTPTTCVAIAVIMHYALLSSLMWMGLEAINMYIALVKVFNTYYRKYMLKMSLVGWGIPLLIVLIAFIVQFATGVPSYQMNSQTEICWLRREVFYGTLVAPFGIIFLLNTIIYCLVLAQLLGMSSRKLKHMDSSRKLRKPAKRENLRKLRGAIGLMALLGISWGFVLGTIDKAALTFAYVFVVFNSSQGFWVFIFHCVLKKEVSKSWKKLICKRGKGFGDSSRWSRFSSSNTRGSRTTSTSGRSMSASSIRSPYLVPKPSISVDKSEVSIGMDSKGLDVVIRTPGSDNPVFFDQEIGSPPPFPPPPVPETKKRTVRRVPRRTSPQPSTTISTQTDRRFTRSSDTDSQSSMESINTTNARQATDTEQNAEDEERRDSVEDNFGLHGVNVFFPHREVVLTPSNESGIYSDTSVSSRVQLVEANDPENRNRGGDLLNRENSNKSNNVTNSAPRRVTLKDLLNQANYRASGSVTYDPKSTDSGISISAVPSNQNSSKSTPENARTDRPQLLAQDSKSSLYSVSSLASCTSVPSSGSEISTDFDPRRESDLPAPHLWKAPLVIRRSEDEVQKTKTDSVFRRKPVLSSSSDNTNKKRSLWKKSRKNSHENAESSPKRKLKRNVPRTESINEVEDEINKLDVKMTNFSLSRGSFHDGAL